MTLKEQVIFGIIIISNMKVMVIKIETYHLMNISIESNHTSRI